MSLALPEPTPPTRQVLLVEDDADQAALLSRWLEADGRTRVVHSKTGHGARYQLSRQREWDAIISDVNLPGCDGIDVLRFAKSRYPQTPIVIMTAQATAEVAVEALRSRADDFLFKPIQRQALVQKVHDLIARAEADRQRGSERVLAVGAHPDDVEIGCGGILLDHVSRGDRVTILTMTCGEHGGTPNERRGESERAAALIGATLRMHDLPDTRITEGVETIAPIEEAIRAARPTIIYTHTPNDAHQDHRAVHRATMVAARQVPNVFCYQSPSSTVDFRPTRFVDVGAHAPKKVEVLAAFASQFHKRSYLSPDLIHATLAYWGRYANYRPVEPLEVVRSSR